jgi:hypothetical protein
MERMRHARYLSVLVLLVVAAVAPAVPAVAATPAITVDDVEGAGIIEIAVAGTVTCSQPTGQANVRYWATNAHPLETADGFGETTVQCAAGPVPWAATARSGIISFDDSFPLLVFASIHRDGVREAFTLRQFPAGWAG